MLTLDNSSNVSTSIKKKNKCIPTTTKIPTLGIKIKEVRNYSLFEIGTISKVITNLHSVEMNLRLLYLDQGHWPKPDINQMLA